MVLLSLGPGLIAALLWQGTDRKRDADTSWMIMSDLSPDAGPDDETPTKPITVNKLTG